MDSHDLAFPTNSFSVSITNFSISTFNDPLRCLREIHRTLQPDGLAIVTTWKRFKIVELIHKAQRAVRTEARLMKVPRPEFMESGYLQDLMVEAGFASQRVQQSVVCTTVQGESIGGIRDFMLGDFTASAREGWTAEEQADWEGAVDDAIEGEKIEHGGIKMDAWVITARKHEGGPVTPQHIQRV